MYFPAASASCFEPAAIIAIREKIIHLTLCNTQRESPKEYCVLSDEIKGQETGVQPHQLLYGFSQ